MEKLISGIGLFIQEKKGSVFFLSADFFNAIRVGHFPLKDLMIKKNAYTALKEHGESQRHRLNVLQLLSCSGAKKTIDSNLIDLYKSQVACWRNVIKRVVSVKVFIRKKFSFPWK
jgi:hypothetical protein